MSTGRLRVENWLLTTIRTNFQWLLFVSILHSVCTFACNPIATSGSPVTANCGVLEPKRPHSIVHCGIVSPSARKDQPKTTKRKRPQQTTRLHYLKSLYYSLSRDRGDKKATGGHISPYYVAPMVFRTLDFYFKSKIACSGFAFFLLSSTRKALSYYSRWNDFGAKIDVAGMIIVCIQPLLRCTSYDSCFVTHLLL